MHVWTDDEDVLLKKLRAEGLSSTLIAARIGRGITRNAVLGRVMRLGLPKITRPDTRAKGRNARIKARRSPTEKKSPWPWRLGSNNSGPRIKGAPMPKPNEFDVGRKTLLDLDKQECKFPIGDGPFKFCALPTKELVPYCQEHLRRCAPALHAKIFQETVEPDETSGAVNVPECV